MTPVRLWLILAGIFFAAVASAEITSYKPEAVEVTIYRDPAAADSDYDSDQSGLGLAMINETRSIEVPAGKSLIRFRGVADAIVPQTAKLSGLLATVVESNFDYDLMSPGALIAKSLGERVRLVRTSSAGRVSETDGILRAGPDGVVVQAGGKFEALGCSGLHEKLVFNHVPTGLADKPTLSMWINARRAGRYRVQLSYLALGLDWSAHYVARINPDGGTLDLTGWITLVNRYRTTFTDAPTHVVAGVLSRVEGETQPPEIKIYRQQARCWPVGSFIRMVRFNDKFTRRGYLAKASMLGGLEQVVVTGNRVAKLSNLGDYKLYTLPEPTTVAARQTKQVRLLEQSDVRFRKVYSFDIGLDVLDRDEPATLHPAILIELQNKTESGLGKPLPAGGFSVMEPDPAGKMIFAGEDRIDDTPVGLPVEAAIGRSTDVWSRLVVAEVRKVAGIVRKVQADIELQIGNDKPATINLEVRQNFDERYNFRVVAESRQHTIKAGDPLWTYTLKPGERETLRYTIEGEE